MLENGHAGEVTVFIGAAHPFGKTGGCVSFTVTVKLHIDMRFDASFTEQVTVVVPFWNTVPDAGAQVGVPTLGQLSLAVGGG